MPAFEPFAGLRYDPARFRPADVTAPPYDVLDEADVAALLERSPRNVVAVDVPLESAGPGRYAMAARTFAGWRAEGTLVADDRASFTVYRMAYADDLGRPVETVGVLGALALSRPGEGGILPHEETTPKARSDRLDLTRATEANLSPVWGLSLTKGLTELLALTEAPLWDWADDDGVTHTVWRVDDPERVAAVREAVAASPVVIADGHHRYEVALAYREERRAVEGDGTPAESTLCFVVELVEDQLTVRPIHRLLGGPGASDGLLEALTATHFDALERLPAGDVTAGVVLRRMADDGALAFVHGDGSATLLRPRPSAFEGRADLDSARLAAALEGVEDVDVAYQHGVELVQRALRDGRAAAGVLLRPATVAQIEANAHAGERMPPKTTFFAPKPKTGIVFRSLR
ncbi:MAG: DUF1015 domain-containing protein [Actinobacteria bacterium]|nr:DUF1015 domain-containing protein [Actinomycetota bacterium]